MPRKSQEEKARTHERIVEVAAAMFRENGIAATGVADVMKAAGLAPFSLVRGRSGSRFIHLPSPAKSYNRHIYIKPQWAGPWKNHAEYVNHMRRVFALFREQGLITAAAAQTFMREAASSTCGRP